MLLHILVQDAVSVVGRLTDRQGKVACMSCPSEGHLVAGERFYEGAWVEMCG